MEYVNWIMNHKTELALVLTSLISVASVIVKLTPTPKDDAILAKVMKVVKALALTPKNVK
jgi:hypothetical protein